MRTVVSQRASPARLGLPPRQRPRLNPAVLMTLLTVVVTLIAVVPIAVAVLSAFRTAPLGQVGSWTLAGLTRFFDDPSLMNVLWTSTWLALVRAAIATGLAVVIAWILARTNCPWRNQLEFLIVVSFFFPSMGKLLGWVVLASAQSGYLNVLLRQLPLLDRLQSGPFDIYSAQGIIFVSTLGWAAGLVMFLLPAFRNMDASLEEAARTSGASTRGAIVWVILPLLRPALMGAFVLAVVRMFSSFETELFLGTPAGVQVFTTKIYERLLDSTPADYPSALSLLFVLLGITVSLVALGSYVIGGSQYTTVSGRSFSNRPVRLGAFRWLAFAIVAAFLVVSLVLPLIFLVQNSVINQFGLNPLNPVNYSLRHWDSVFSLEQPRKSIANTFILAIGAATIGVALYTLVAYVIVRGRFRAKRLLDMVVWIPGAVPTLVLGMAILWTILPSPLGALYGSLALLILAHVIRGLPGETRLMVSTIVQISGELEESARVHGVSWLRTYTAIWLPLLKPGLVTAWTFTFVIAFYDLSLVVFLYGPNSTVLPTLFLSLWRGGQIEKASVAALIMVTMIFVVVTIVRRFSRSGLPSTPET